MDQHHLRIRLLHLLGSTSVLAGIAVGTWACNSDDSDDADSSGNGGTQASSGSSGMSSGSSGMSSGSSGMSSGSGGTTPMGGRLWGAAAGGTCYAVSKCMAPADAWAMAAQDSGGSAEPPDPSSCPVGSQMPREFCSGYANGTFDSGQCCYEYWSGSCCGRPFVVGEEQRTAGSARRSDWLSDALESSARDGMLDAVTRRALAEAWLHDARLEHASVASFARFAMQLLAVGAPASLVERAHAAMGDEIRHARTCFSLATRFASDPLGPGMLELGGSLDGQSLAEMAASTVLEGCVGETLAALEAGERFAVATDAGARAALEMIQNDEAAHAELAWAFTRWALRRGGDAVRHVVEQAFAEARSRLEKLQAEPMQGVDVAALHAHGHLTPSESVACQRAAFDAVIAPCRDALLADAPAARV